MILVKKLLLMNISAPCRESGLYTFWAAMGAPEHEHNPVKLTKFKKMASSSELDKCEEKVSKITLDSSKITLPGAGEDSSKITLPGAGEDSSKITLPGAGEDSSKTTLPGLPGAGVDSSKITLPGLPGAGVDSKITLPGAGEDSSKITLPGAGEDSSKITLPGLPGAGVDSKITLPGAGEDSSKITLPGAGEDSSKTTLPGLPGAGVDSKITLDSSKMTLPGAGDNSLLALHGPEEHNSEGPTGNSKEGEARNLKGGDLECVGEAAPVLECVGEAAPVLECVGEAAPVLECVGEAAPVLECVGEAAPVLECVGEAAPVLECVEETAPVLEYVGDKVPVMECVGETVPVLECVGEAAPVLECVGEATPVLECVGETVPLLEYVGETAPVLECVGETAPVLECVGETVPVLECVGETVPVLECVGETVPVLECVGETAPVLECVGETVPVLECVGETALVLECVGETVPVLECVGETAPVLECVRERQPSVQCVAETNKNCPEVECVVEAISASECVSVRDKEGPSNAQCTTADSAPGSSNSSSSSSSNNSSSSSSKCGLTAPRSKECGNTILESVNECSGAAGISHTVSEGLQASRPTGTCFNTSYKDMSDAEAPLSDGTTLTQAGTLTECHSSEDQDSLDLSDVEGSSPASPLDLSDLLRISEDVLAHNPSKTLNLLQRHLEKGGALLEEAATVGETEASVKELARALHLHLTQFTDRLHHTRDRLEDTARCYHLLDKAYEWALEAMKVVGRVKGEGLASPEQVGAAGRTLTAYLEQHPPIPDDTFTAMTTLATRLNNHTLLQQCKMAQVRCQETNELLRNRQAALYKAKRQMEFDCQSFVDLGEVFGGGGGGEEMSPLAWLACSPLNVSGRRRSVSSLGSRPRDSLSRCPSLDTDDDSVFLDPPPPPAPAKTPLEPRTSLGGIKEVRESAEDLEQPSTPGNTKLTSPSGTTTSSSGSSGRCGSSSCSSSESSGPVSINKKFMKRANTWQYGLIPKGHTDDNTGMDDGVPLSPTSHKSIPPSSAVNSHLLIRGSQLNLSINMDDLSQEEVKKSKTLLLTMRELIQTERDYVNSLEYIIENYIPELMREDIPQALRGQRNVVFGNIEKIYEFHSGYFLRALEACEMRPFAVGSIFLRYESQFYLYALYNKNKPKSDSLMSEYGSAFFRKKQLELEDRMDLASYLLKPVQRMGKYALILKQLLKECGRGEENYDEIQGAQEMVQFQLRHGNDLLAMDSLRDCDVNLKEQGRLLRQGEFVVWEGSRAKKSVRHVFLFEDLILFSKARRDPEKKALDIFQYKHSMKMTDIGLTEQVSVSTTKFEIWFRKRKPSDTYLFQAPSAEMKEAWTEEISKLLWRQALRNRTMRLHEMSSMGIGNKPCLDIRPSEDQISDRSISINQLNKAPRLRTGSTSAIGDLNGGVGKRPHSIISVSSSSASSSASSASSSHSSTVCPTYVGALNLGFEAGNSPRPLHRSVTRTSQCSAESGILADMYSGGDDDAQSHRRVERSNSTVTTVSVDSALSPVSSCSPVFPVAPTSPSLIMVSPTRPTDVIYETQSVTPTVKDSSAKMLLTTEV
ncbi:uncharacterized protein [Procambarus clarkii]|uniref:uncharacterized protein isoform X2 n=1 Tax=Procambarus clarkii TaxID=6728 RepID=UPI003741EC8A